MSQQSMIVAGVMSGTSADGVDVALVRITPAAAPDLSPGIELLGHEQFPYEAAIRGTVLQAMDGKPTAPADLARLHWRLGRIYAECVAATAGRYRIQPELVACHGQTIYHQAAAGEFCGAPVRATWQIGEASAIAERLRIPVVSDFRPADLAADGQGAPLVPMLDYTLFRSVEKNRILLNLGGIANVTAIPAEGDIHSLFAFDTGPANMVIDALMQRLTGKAYDCGGQTAAKGAILSSVVEAEMRAPYFAAAPPKSCGREEFGSPFVDRFLAECEAAGGGRRDILATATALTAASIVAAVKDFCLPRFAGGDTELIASGGGTGNAFLLQILRQKLEGVGAKLIKMDDIGIPSEAKEAVAFALLGWLTWHRLPGNVPAATGASRPVILGKITYV